MEPSQTSIPPLKDLTIDNITDNVNLTNTHVLGPADPRFSFLLSRLTTHLHDFARETRLSFHEWNTAIQFLTAVGHMCTDTRQEFILLSDILGISLLVDSIDHPKPSGATEGTVLGPFHTHDAEDVGIGGVLSHDEKGESLLVLCSVKDLQGRPVPDVKVDVWETDSSGFYDVQYAGREKPDGRGIVVSDQDGKFWFKAIVPVPYPIPHDGPVGQLLQRLGRHPMRPGHMHFMFEKAGWDTLITALYLKGDPYESSDAVFGVKESLLVDLGRVNKTLADEYGVEEGAKLLTYDFVLVTEEESRKLREERSRLAMEKLGKRVRMVEGLPVPEVD